MFSKRSRGTKRHNCLKTIHTLGSAVLAHFIPKCHYSHEQIRLFYNVSLNSEMLAESRNPFSELERCSSCDG